MFMVLSSCLKHCESSPWFTRWVQHGARWPPTSRPSRSAWTISPPLGCQLLHSPSPFYYYSVRKLILILPSHGWVGLVGWLRTRWFTRSHTVTHPSTNRARRRVTSLIDTNALPLSHATNIQTAMTTIHRLYLEIHVRYLHHTRVIEQWREKPCTACSKIMLWK